MTIASVEAIENASVVAFPVSKKGKVGFAKSIAEKWLIDKKKTVPLFFPMVQDQELCKRAWKIAAMQLIDLCNAKEKVVFLSLGDVSLFSTSSYLLLEIKKQCPDLNIEMIPGINSFSAVAASAKWPLAIQDDQLLIIPTPNNKISLENILDDAAYSKRVIALMKLGKRWSWVRDLLIEKNLLDKCIFAKNVGFEDQIITPAIQIDYEECPYFSLLLIRQHWPENLIRL
tara:strand:- start:336 stop:1022 length:687 start_codon:yes stop_codon:yes gene_type:complete